MRTISSSVRLAATVRQQWDAMKGVAALVSMLMAAGCAQPPEPTSGAFKPALYTIRRPGGQQIDLLISQNYSRDFRIVYLPDEKGLGHAKVVEGQLPRNATDDSGAELAGYLSILYVIETNGLATHPLVVTNTNPHLRRFALDAMQQWRFEPARLGGEAIATTAVQEFHFPGTQR